MTRSIQSIPPVLFVFALAAGCAGPTYEIGPVKSEFKFDNVRVVGDLDEWKHISEVLSARAKEKSFTFTVKNSRNFGEIKVQDYEATLTVPKLRDLEQIHTDLDRLAKRKFDNEKIEFKLLWAKTQLGYRSNYVLAELDILLRGITDPKAVLTIYLHSGDKQDIPVGPDGSWSANIKVAARRQFIYGYSTDRVTGVVKYFRIDIFSQQQDAVGSDEFGRLRNEQP